MDTVMEGIRSEKPVAQICRERNIRDSVYDKWRDWFNRAGAFISVQPPHDLLSKQTKGNKEASYYSALRKVE